MGITLSDQLALEYRAMRQLAQQVYIAIAHLLPLTLCHDPDMLLKLTKLSHELEGQCEQIAIEHNQALKEEAQSVRLC